MKVNKLIVNRAPVSNKEKVAMSVEFGSTNILLSKNKTFKFALILYKEDEVKVGDLVVADWGGNGDVTDMRYGILKEIKGNVYTIENQFGNTSRNSDETFPNFKIYKLYYTTDKTLDTLYISKAFVRRYTKDYDNIKEVYCVERNNGRVNCIDNIDNYEYAY